MNNANVTHTYTCARENGLFRRALDGGEGPRDSGAAAAMYGFTPAASRYSSRLNHIVKPLALYENSASRSETSVVYRKSGRFTGAYMSAMSIAMNCDTVSETAVPRVQVILPRGIRDLKGSARPIS
eukprot:1156154-Rhodomonas_salina.2